MLRTLRVEIPASGTWMHYGPAPEREISQWLAWWLQWAEFCGIAAIRFEVRDCKPLIELLSPTTRELAAEARLHRIGGR